MEFLGELERRAGRQEGGRGVVGWMVGLVAEVVGVEPWRVLVPVSVLVAIGAVVLLRSGVVGWVSLLQWGF